MWGLSELGTATASHFGPQGLSQMIKQRFTRNDGAESPTDWKMLLSAGLKHTWWPTSQPCNTFRVWSRGRQKLQHVTYKQGVRFPVSFLYIIDGMSFTRIWQFLYQQFSAGCLRASGWATELWVNIRGNTTQALKHVGKS